MKLVTYVILALVMMSACGGGSSGADVAQPPNDTGGASPPPVAPQFFQSELWGEDGAPWHPRSRLPDFSFSGYRQSDAAWETPQPVVSVADFGAVGDGQTDDTQAFFDALEQTASGTLFVPAGEYLISDVLRINRSSLTIQGAGMDLTTIRIDISLDDLDDTPYTLTPPPPGGPFSHFGGFFYFGDLALAGRSGPHVADITTDVARGERTLQLADAPQVAVGDRVVLEMTDPGDGSLSRHLHGGDLDGPVNQRGARLIRFVARVAGVDGLQVTVDRPLRFDVEGRWQPRLFHFASAVSEVGLTDLTIRFAPTQAPEHHADRVGRNGIHVFSAQDCYFANLRVVNADNGLQLTDSHFCTVRNLILAASRPANTQGHTGHHGVDIKGFSSQNLIAGFDLQTQFTHDLSLSSSANGNVFANGAGVNVNFDHHKGGSFENLFTDIDVGVGDRLWVSSGAANNGPHSGARQTYWNIRAQTGLSLPPQTSFTGNFEFGARHSTFVGLDGVTFETKTCFDLWSEHGEGVAVDPADLFAAQLDRRRRQPEPTGSSLCSF